MFPIPDFDCPLDLQPEEEIEISDSIAGIIQAKVVDIVSGIISIKIDAFSNSVFSIDPTYTKWRRLGKQIAAPKYGARCADKYCPIGFFEHAEIVEGWKCRQCRAR